jgi:hypothetical protein
MPESCALRRMSVKQYIATEYRSILAFDSPRGAAFFPFRSFSAPLSGRCHTGRFYS